MHGNAVNASLSMRNVVLETYLLLLIIAYYTYVVLFYDTSVRILVGLVGTGSVIVINLQ